MKKHHIKAKRINEKLSFIRLDFPSLGSFLTRDSSTRNQVTWVNRIVINITKQY